MCIRQLFITNLLNIFLHLLFSTDFVVWTINFSDITVPKTYLGRIERRTKLENAGPWVFSSFSGLIDI